MSKNEEIFRFVVANQALEGMVMSADEKNVLKECLENKRSFKDAVQDVISAYAVKGTQ